MLPASSPINERFTLQRRCSPFAKVGALQKKGRLWLGSHTWSQCAEAAPVGGNTQQMEIVGTERLTAIVMGCRWRPYGCRASSQPGRRLKALEEGNRRRRLRRWGLYEGTTCQAGEASYVFVLSFFCSALSAHSSVPACCCWSAARKICQGRRAAPPTGLVLDGSSTALCWCQSRVRLLFSPLTTGSLSAGPASISMARAMIASAYIRQLRSGLPLCCMHGRSRGKDGTHL
jgi:hypothetical protein